MKLLGRNGHRRGKKIHEIIPFEQLLPRPPKVFAGDPFQSIAIDNARNFFFGKTMPRRTPEEEILLYLITKCVEEILSREESRLRKRSGSFNRAALGKEVLRLTSCKPPW